MDSRVIQRMLLEPGDVIRVFGKPNLRNVIYRLPRKDWTKAGFMGPGMICAAMPATNAVPEVLAAKSGIVVGAALSPVAGRMAR